MSDDLILISHGDGSNNLEIFQKWSEPKKGEEVPMPKADADEADKKVSTVLNKLDSWKKVLFTVGLITSKKQGSVGADELFRATIAVGPAAGKGINFKLRVYII